MRKLVYAICKQQRRRSASAQSDQRLCCCIISFYIRNFKPLTSFSVTAQAGLSLTLYNNNFFQEDNMFGTNASLAYGP